MTRYGKELKFISEIGRDGTSILEGCPGMKVFDNDKFKLIRLSIDHGTYIAFENLNFYIVKLKCDQ